MISFYNLPLNARQIRPQSMDLAARLWTHALKLFKVLIPLQTSLYG